MLDFFNGKYGLARTYWFGVVGTGLVGRAFSYWITQQYLSAAMQGGVARVELIHILFQIVLSLILALMLRAVWLAANADRTPGIWGWIGLGLTAIGLFYSVVTTIMLMFPSVATPMFMMQLEIREFNKQLPQQMGEGLTMLRTEIKDGILTYYVVADYAVEAAVVVEMQNPLIENAIGQELCRDTEGYFKGGLKYLAFQYDFTNETVSQSLSRQDCQDWLATR